MLATRKTQRVNNIALLLSYDNKYKRTFVYIKQLMRHPSMATPLQSLLSFK